MSAPQWLADSLPALGTLGLGLSAWSFMTSPLAPLLGPLRWPRLYTLLTAAGVAGMASSVTLALQLGEDGRFALIPIATPFAALLVSFAVVRTLAARWGGAWITAWLQLAFQLHLPWFVQTAVASASNNAAWSFHPEVWCHTVGFASVLLITERTLSRYVACAKRTASIAPTPGRLVVRVGGDRPAPVVVRVSGDLRGASAARALVAEPRCADKISSSRSQARS